MSTSMRILWLLALAVFASGCSTIRTVTLPGDMQPTVPGRESETVLEPGDKVTIELQDGSEVTGIAREISDTAVIVQNEETYTAEIEYGSLEGAEMNVVARKEIVAITKTVTDPGKTVLLVALLGFTAIGIASADYSPDWEWGGTWEGGIMTH